MKLSLTNYFLNNLLLEDTEWKQHFLVGSKGMPRTNPEIIDYVESLYETVYGGEYKAKLNMAKWLIGAVESLGGPKNIGTEDRDKLLSIVSYAKEIGGEGNIPKLSLDDAYKKAQEKLQSKKPEQKSEKSPMAILPTTQLEKNGIVERLGDVPDGSGRIIVKVAPGKNREFYETICDANKTFGFGCQTTIDVHAEKTTTAIVLLGPPKGNFNGPIATLFTMTIKNGTIIDAKQYGNQVIGGQSIDGYDDLDKVFVQLLISNIGKKYINKLEGTGGDYFNWTTTSAGVDKRGFITTLLKRDVSLLYLLDNNRPDLIDSIMPNLKKNSETRSWLENRVISAVDVANKNPEKFLSNLSSYSKAKDFQEAIQIIIPKISEIAKKNPQLILDNVNILIDYTPFETFNTIFKSVDLTEYITNNRDSFERLIRKLGNVNSKDAKQYKELMKSILDQNAPIIINAYGGGVKGLKFLLDFLSMSKIDKHTFSKKVNGQIYIYKDEVTVAPDGERTTKQVEVPLKDDLAVLPQKERKDFILKNEKLIKSFFEGTEEEKKIKFFRVLFLETNIQEVERTLKKEKDEFINYFNTHPNKNTGYPGIMEFYSIINKNKGLHTGESKQPIFKMELEDARNIENGKRIFRFYKNNSDKNTEIGKILTAVHDYFYTLQISGENLETIYSKILSNYTPKKLVGAIDSKNEKKRNANYGDYIQFFKMLSDFFPKTRVKETITQLEPEIKDIGSFGEKSYQDLLASYSDQGYDIAEQDFILFTGKVGHSREIVDGLTFGRKYSIGELRDFAGYKNGEVRVYNDVKRLSDWIPTSMFDVKKVMMEKTIRSYIRDKIKNKFLMENEKPIKKHIAYSAVVLDEESKSKLLNEISIPEGWEMLADHLTIRLGELKDKSIIGQSFIMKVISVAQDDKVMAVQVETDAPSKSAIKHITVAVDRNNGGKPVMSSDLTNWKKIQPFNLKGTVKEVELVK